MSRGWRRTENLAAVAISLTLVAAVVLLRGHPPSSQAAMARITLAQEYLVQYRAGGGPLRGGAVGDAVGGPRCPATASSMQNLVYISHAGVAERLGCPINHTMACFYCFNAALPEVEAPANMLVNENDCDRLYRPLPVDEGRGWCIREGRRPDWVLDTLAGSQQTSFQLPVLLTGKLNGPNPTHQANLHFHAIWRWMRQNEILPGDLHMLVDFPEKSWAPGKYGTGMGNSLGKVQWLLDLDPGYVHFKHIQFSIPDGQYFPFDLKHLTLDTPLDMAFMELAENIKLRLLQTPKAVERVAIPSSELAPGAAADVVATHAKDVTEPKEAPPRPVRVVLAQRNAPNTRVWANVEELARELIETHGNEVEVVSFGALPFTEQVEKVATANVLVGITGSDLVNLMFLPHHGSVVEIFPSVGAKGMFVPELANMAQMLGKNHFPFVTHGNITVVNENESRLLYRVQELNVGPASNLAALVNHAAYQALHGSSLQHSSCGFSDGLVKCEPK